jgi:hypothetical protein
MSIYELTFQKIFKFTILVANHGTIERERAEKENSGHKIRFGDFQPQDDEKNAKVVN